jgi:riboflavin kinase / FMN adenylyltransferase
MEIIRDINSAYITRPTVLTIGSFDGIHRGHQHLIGQIVARAKEESGMVSALVTLHPHPKVVLRPNSQMRYLSTIEERLDLLAPLGLDYVVVFPFSLETSQIRARDFIQILIDRLSLTEIICGKDFALGYKREGTVDFLRAMGREKGFAVTIVEPYALDGEIVSSTRIRELIAVGDLEQATRLLGRHPSIRGRVIRGDQRGRTLGFPTANLAVPERRQIPADGIYATRVNIGRRRFSGAANVGIRPTFDKGQRLIEVFILDFDEDLYDQVITVEFVKRLREELKFDSVNALIEQMGKDVVETRLVLAAADH